MCLIKVVQAIIIRVLRMGGSQMGVESLIAWGGEAVTEPGSGSSDAPVPSARRHGGQQSVTSKQLYGGWRGSTLQFPNPKVM